MLKKILASVGGGSSSIDLEVKNTRVELGGTLEGVVNIKGGIVSLDVNQIYINLVLISWFEHGDETKSITKTLSSVTVGGKMVLEPGQADSFRVEFQVPFEMPVTRGRTHYYLQSGLDLNLALDLSAKDEITVIPNRQMIMLFDALESLGFREQDHSGDFNGQYQQFAFKPTAFMSGELDELEIFPAAHQDELDIVMQIDKRNPKFKIPYSTMNTASELATFLKNQIESELHKIV